MKPFATDISIFTIHLHNGLQYKINGFIYTIFDIIPPLISMFFWNKAFDTQTLVNGQTQNQLTTYFLLSAVISSLLIPHPEYELSQQINQGVFSRNLIKPIPIYRYWLWNELSYKWIRFIFTLPSFFVLVWIGFHLTGQPLPLSLSLLQLPLFISMFLVIFNIKFITGLAAVWFTEIRWIIGITELIGLLFSGAILPLDFFPQWYIRLSQFLPFQFFAYIPIKLVQGQIIGTQLTLTIISLVIWLITSFLISSIVLKKAIKSYTAYGG